jgi:hypothetical protein
LSNGVTATKDPPAAPGGDNISPAEWAAWNAAGQYSGGSVPFTRETVGMFPRTATLPGMSTPGPVIPESAQQGPQYQSRYPQFTPSLSQQPPGPTDQPAPSGQAPPLTLGSGQSPQAQTSPALQQQPPSQGLPSRAALTLSTPAPQPPSPPAQGQQGFVGPDTDTAGGFIGPNTDLTAPQQIQYYSSLDPDQIRDLHRTGQIDEDTATQAYLAADARKNSQAQFNPQRFTDDTTTALAQIVDGLKQATPGNIIKGIGGWWQKLGDFGNTFTESFGGTSVPEERSFLDQELQTGRINNDQHAQGNALLDQVGPLNQQLAKAQQTQADNAQAGIKDPEIDDKVATLQLKRAQLMQDASPIWFKDHSQRAIHELTLTLSQNYSHLRDWALNSFGPEARASLQRYWGGHSDFENADDIRKFLQTDKFNYQYGQRVQAGIPGEAEQSIIGALSAATGQQPQTEAQLAQAGIQARPQRVAGMAQAIEPIEQGLAAGITWPSLGIDELTTPLIDKTLSLSSAIPRSLAFAGKQLAGTEKRYLGWETVQELGHFAHDWSQAGWSKEGFASAFSDLTKRVGVETAAYTGGKALEFTGNLLADSLQQAATNNFEGGGFLRQYLGRSIRTGAHQVPQNITLAAATSGDPYQFGENLGTISVLHQLTHVPGDVFNAFTGDVGDSLYVGRSDKPNSPVNDLQYRSSPTLDSLSQHEASKLDPSQYGLYTRVKDLMRSYAQIYLLPRAELMRLAQAYGATNFDGKGFAIGGDNPSIARFTGGKSAAFIDTNYFDDAFLHEAVGHPAAWLLTPAERAKGVDLIRKTRPNDFNTFTQNYQRRMGAPVSDYDSLPTWQELQTGAKPPDPSGLTKDIVHNELLAEQFGAFFKGKTIDQWAKDPGIRKQMGMLFGAALEKLHIPSSTAESMTELGLRPSVTSALHFYQWLQDLYNQKITNPPSSVGTGFGPTGQAPVSPPVGGAPAGPVPITPAPPAPLLRTPTPGPIIPRTPKPPGGTLPPTTTPTGATIAPPPPATAPVPTTPTTPTQPTAPAQPPPPITAPPVTPPEPPAVTLGGAQQPAAGAEAPEPPLPPEQSAQHAQIKAKREAGIEPGRAQKQVQGLPEQSLRDRSAGPGVSYVPGQGGHHLAVTGVPQGRIAGDLIGSFGYQGDATGDRESIRGHGKWNDNMTPGYSAGLTYEGGRMRGIQPGQEFTAGGRVFRWDDLTPSHPIVGGRVHNTPVEYVDVFNPSHAPDPGGKFFTGVAPRAQALTQVSAEPSAPPSPEEGQAPAFPWEKPPPSAPGLTESQVEKAEEAAMEQERYYAPRQSDVEPENIYRPGGMYGMPPGAPGFAQPAMSFMPGGRTMGGIQPQQEGGEPVESTAGIPNPESFTNVRKLIGQGTISGLSKAIKEHASSLSDDDIRVKKQADDFFKGEHFVPGDPLHETLLANTPATQKPILMASQQAIAQKRPMHITYASAPPPPGQIQPPTTRTAEVRYEASSPQARLLGTTDARLSGHTMIPTAVGIAPAKKQGEQHQGYVQGISTNVAANNWWHINQALKRAGVKTPYPHLDDRFENDLHGYIANLNAGHRGTGDRYMPGTETYPAHVDYDYVPYDLKPHEADFLNAVLHNRHALAKTGGAARELARKGGTLLTEEGETNPIRQMIDEREPLDERNRAWSEHTLEPTIRTFKAGLVHALHQRPEDMPQAIRPGEGFKPLTRTLGMALGSEKGRPDIPIAVSFMPAPLTEEEHKELTGNIRKQYLSGKMRTSEYLERMKEIPSPGISFMPSEKPKPPGAPGMNFMPGDIVQGPKGQQERIKAAAIRSPITGKIYEGPAHYMAMSQALEAEPEFHKHASDPNSPNRYGEQGFTTDSGRFLGRSDAFKLAKKAEQVPQQWQHQPMHSGFLGAEDIPELRSEQQQKAYQWAKERTEQQAETKPPEAPSGLAEEPEQVQSAAMRIAGKHYEGLIHADALENARAQGAKGPYESGFTTNKGRFVSAEEAWDLAKKNKQLKEGATPIRTKKGGPASGLTSADLAPPEAPQISFMPGKAQTPISRTTKRTLGPRPDDEEQGKLWDKVARRLDDQDPSAVPLVPDIKQDGTFRTDSKGNPQYKKTQYNLAESPLLRQLGKNLGTQINPTTGKPAYAKAPKETDTLDDQLDPENRLRPFLNPTDQKRVVHLNNISAVDTLADKLVGMYKGIQHLPEVMAGKDWYDEAIGLLRHHFGKDADLVANLLGATSAGQNVKGNFHMAMEAYHKFLAGDYDDAIKLYQHAYGIRQAAGGGKAGDRAIINHVTENKIHEALGEAAPTTGPAAMEQYIAHHKITPKGHKNQLFATNSLPVLKVLAHTWAAEAGGPKTPNFAGNLSGKSLQATIDMWAARTMHRLSNEGYTKKPWRIQPAAEPAVHDTDFGLGQLAFRKAAEKVGLKPSALQAVIWFAEQKHWQKMGWEQEQDPENRDYRPMLRAYKHPVGVPIAGSKPHLSHAEYLERVPEVPAA